MRCRNCGHAAELHDENEGFCNAKIYHSEAMENASVPEQCDCPTYEPEGEITQVDQTAVRKLRRINAIETLLANERRLLEEQGRRWSKRSRKLEERLRRVIRDEEILNSEEHEEPDANDISGVDRGQPASVVGGTISRRPEGESAEPRNETLKARVAALEKLVASQRFEGLEFKIGAKGGVSVYGLGRFPVTLYYEQWVRLLDSADGLVPFWKKTRTS